MPGVMPSLQDHINGAAHAGKPGRQTAQLPCTAGKNSSRDRIGVTVADIYNDIEPQAAVLRNCRIHCSIQEHHKRSMSGRSRRAGVRFQAGRAEGSGLKRIDSEIHPHAGKGALDRSGYAGLSG